jgi:hypothetical protein
MITFFDEKNVKKTFNKKQMITAGKSLTIQKYVYASFKTPCIAKDFRLCFFISV